MKKSIRKTATAKKPAAKTKAKAKAKRQPNIVFETPAARRVRDLDSTPELDQGRVALETAEERRERELASSANIDRARLAERALAAKTAAKVKARKKTKATA